MRTFQRLQEALEQFTPAYSVNELTHQLEVPVHPDKLYI